MIQKIRNAMNGGMLREMYGEAKWIFQYAKRYRLQILFYIGLGLVGTGMGLSGSVISKFLIDAVTGYQAPKLAVVITAFIAVNLLSLLITYSSGLISAKISTRVQNEIRADIFDQILLTNWEVMADYHSGELLNRLNGDVTTVSSNVLSWLPGLISRIFQFAGSLGIILYYDPTMAVFALLSVPVTVLLSRFLMKKIREYNLKSREINGEVISFNEEALQNIQTIKCFGLAGLFSERMRTVQKKYEDVVIETNRFSQKNSLFMGMVNQVVSLSCFGWCVYRLWSGHITYGTMTMFLSIASGLSASASGLISMVPQAIGATTSAKRLMELVMMPKEEDCDKEAAEEMRRTSGVVGIRVRLSDMSFHYKNGKAVFKQVSMEALPGRITALVGPSGEGKTTMLRIFLSLMKPQSGECILENVRDPSDRINISASTRRLFSYVPQGNTMFSGTIADNLQMVKKDASREEMEEALKVACAYDFVAKLPDGIYHKIGERGQGFSEGQAQRLSIARALLCDAPVLLLDEATSALDVEMERRILRNIANVKNNKTCIVTTHRPSVLSMCDMVYRINQTRLTILKPEEINRFMDEF